jgi:hypothetical protein
LADVGPWQIAVNPSEIAADTSDIQGVQGARVALPALGSRLEGDAWLDQPDAPAWRLRGADKNGRVDFTALTPDKAGKVGYAVTYLFSSTAREASFALESDRWLIMKVNGRTCVDQSKEGSDPGASRKGSVRRRIWGCI